MTLIIAIKCEDGVVVGADGAATLGNVSQSTILQPVRKLRIIENAVIFGMSGPVGLGQAFEKAIEQLVKLGKLKNPEKIFSEMRDAMWSYAEKEWSAAGVVSKAIGAASMHGVMSACVLAMQVLDTPCLFQFNHQCSPEEATRDLPFICIGSGQASADPFLAFLRRIFWPAKLPLLSDGILATLWSLEQAILTSPGGVSRPIQIMTLAKNKQTKKWVVAELSEDELVEHRQNMADAEAALASYKRGQQVSEPAAVPPLPDRPETK